ncbi:MAG: 6,7-dimethyl-8-ribityllumazine synthase [Brumimicrobium sp.]|nr:6,7-dimethyl-8-ribityllumazine synthase [Brumimicrobium sp.]
MATANTNLSSYDSDTIPSGADFKIGIVVSEWNENITSGLLKGAKETLLKHDVKEENIFVYFTPGSFELALGAQFILESQNVDGVIALGCVIQGETRHFDFVCNGVAMGIKDVGLKYNKPVIFGVLTDNTMEQSIARSGGKHGNKGIECAVACLKMIALKNNLK